MIYRPLVYGVSHIGRLGFQNFIAKEKHHHAHHDDAQAQYFA